MGWLTRKRHERLLRIYIREQIEKNGLAMMDPQSAFFLNPGLFKSGLRACDVFRDEAARENVLTELNLKPLIFRLADGRLAPIVSKKMQWAAKILYGERA